MSGRSEPFSSTNPTPDRTPVGADATRAVNKSNSSGTNSTTAADIDTAAAAAAESNPKKQLGDIILELRHVSKSFPIEDATDLVHALRDVSLCDDLARAGKGFPAIRQGEFVMIRGPSGGGKTTLLNMIGTIDLPTTGDIQLLGSKIDKESGDEFLSMLRLRQIGFVFQTFNLLSTMTALENVELPMTLLGELSEQERRSRAKKLLALVGLRNRTHHLPSELSGGEQQRVTIARALSNNPGLLLLDEPTGDLDTATTISVMDLLCQINYMSGVTMIMVTHNPDVECYADRILYVGDGAFKRQVTNACPVPLVREEYEAYLKAMDYLPTHETGEKVTDHHFASMGKREDRDENVKSGAATAAPAAAHASGSGGSDDFSVASPSAPAAPISANISGGIAAMAMFDDSAYGDSNPLENPPREFEPNSLFKPQVTSVIVGSPTVAADSSNGGGAEKNVAGENDELLGKSSAQPAPKREVPAWRKAAEARAVSVVAASSAVEDLLPPVKKQQLSSTEQNAAAAAAAATTTVVPTTSSPAAPPPRVDLYHAGLKPGKAKTGFDANDL